LRGNIPSASAFRLPEWRTMAVLGGAPGLSARDVAERTAMDKVQVSARRREPDAGGPRAGASRCRGRPHHAPRPDGEGRTIYEQVVPKRRWHLEDVFLSGAAAGRTAPVRHVMSKTGASGASAGSGLDMTYSHWEYWALPRSRRLSSIKYRARQSRLRVWQWVARDPERAKAYAVEAQDSKRRARLRRF